MMCNYDDNNKIDKVSHQILVVASAHVIIVLHVKTISTFNC